jgi:predicted nucleic acid-binding protein
VPSFVDTNILVYAEDRDAKAKALEIVEEYLTFRR